jgi:uncharacterized protein (DUF2267 family)
VDHDAFVSIVQKFAGTDRESAERAARSVLSVLGERLGADEARAFVYHLPPELGPWLHTAGGARSFDAEEFVRRVAALEETDPDTAELHVTAVLDALARALPEREYSHLLTRLSKDYAPLLPKAPVPPAMSMRALLDRIARRAGIDAREARTAAEAVLQTLAERIAAGEVTDLTTRLPVGVHGALKRGLAGADEATRRMPPDEFLRRVAERAGVSEERARQYTRAVLATVREATREDFYDVAVQLPDPYRDLLGTE